MAAGRPRTVSLSPDEMIELGEEMLNWVLENESKVLHLSQWYTIHKMFTYKQWKTFIQCQEFLPYYEKALKIIGLKYLDKNSNVRDGISQRWQRSYFNDLVEREDLEADQKAAREKEAEGSKNAVYHIYASSDLAVGSQIPAKNLSNPSDQSPQ